MSDEERHVDQDQPRKQIAGDRVLKSLGVDPNNWTVGDRLIVLLAIGMGLAIVIIAVCGYVFSEWEWTGLTKPKLRTFWDWLNLLIVPLVLALGGYLFTRVENSRTLEIANKQRVVDREIAKQRTEEDRWIANHRGQDDALQAYLDQIGQLLLDKQRPLRKSKEGDEERTLARARTKEVLWKLSPYRKRSLLQFLHEASLIKCKTKIINLSGADLSDASLRELDLKDADLTGADMRGADLSSANLSEADLRGAMNWSEEQLLQARSLEGAFMPDGRKYEDWLKSKGSGKEGENSGPS